MFMLEVLSNGCWETVAECFDTEAEAELYYRHRLGGFEGYRVIDTEEV